MRGDSKLVVDQVMKAVEPRDPRMCAYYKEVRRLKERFKGFELKHNYRSFNEEADRLLTIASGREPVPEGVFSSDLYEPSVKIEHPGERTPAASPKARVDPEHAGGWSPRPATPTSVLSSSLDSTPATYQET